MNIHQTNNDITNFWQKFTSYVSLVVSMSYLIILRDVISDIYKSPPPGTNKDVLVSLSGSPHVIHVYIESMKIHFILRGATVDVIMSLTSGLRRHIPTLSKHEGPYYGGYTDAHQNFSDKTDSRFG